MRRVASVPVLNKLASDPFCYSAIGKSFGELCANVDYDEIKFTASGNFVVGFERRRFRSCFLRAIKTNIQEGTPQNWLRFLLRIIDNSSNFVSQSLISDILLLGVLLNSVGMFSIRIADKSPKELLSSWI
jgi:hypothetical protein